MWRQSNSVNGMKDEITHNDIDRRFYQLRSDPERFLELTNKLVEQHPQDANAYFVRHQAWSQLACFDLALTDLNNRYISRIITPHTAREGRRFVPLAAIAKRSTPTIALSHWIRSSGKALSVRCSRRLPCPARQRGGRARRLRNDAG